MLYLWLQPLLEMCEMDHQHLDPIRYSMIGLIIYKYHLKSEMFGLESFSL